MQLITGIIMQNKSYTIKTTILLSVLLFMLSSYASESKQSFISQAGNLTYQGIYDQQLVHLKKGLWQGKPFQPGSASRPRVGLIKDFSFSGDLNQDGQPEQIVFLWESSGGSGTGVYMAVLIRHNGQWTNIATQFLGDRVQLQMGRVQQGKIELDIIQAGDKDPACCPTQHVLRSWSLKGTKLQEAPILDLGEISIKDLQGINWRLVKLNWQEQVPDSSTVTLQFKANKVSGFSACNRFTASVSDGKIPGNIKFGPITGTRKYCEQEVMELETRFLKALVNTRSFSFVNGHLTLEWQDDGAVSTLFFRPVK